MYSSTWRLFVFHKSLRFIIQLFIVLFQIYTDWANHYLEKARSKKRVNSLAADCSDGVLLAEVIESVSKYNLRLAQLAFYYSVDKLFKSFVERSTGGTSANTSSLFFFYLTLFSLFHVLWLVLN